jgi:hypothetical protein
MSLNRALAENRNCFIEKHVLLLKTAVFSNLEFLDLWHPPMWNRNHSRILCDIFFESRIASKMFLKLQKINFHKLS